MDTYEKLDVLSEAARFDICASACGSPGRKRDDLNRETRWLYPAKLPDGRTSNMLKVLMSGECTNSCTYCANRAGTGPAVAFSHDELAKTFSLMNRSRLAQGLFLSSAIAGSAGVQMEKMVKTCEILRTRFRFRGYIHLKVLPGASRHLVEAGAMFADRMSINHEAAGEDALRILAPGKSMKYIRECTKLISSLARNPETRLKGQATQFLVGATEETDSQYLTTIEGLLKDPSMKRVYFNAFHPIAGTPLEDAPPTPLNREMRLYQAEHLLREYGFTRSDLTLNRGDNLHLDIDVKLATALNHPEWFPIEVNNAARRQLLRVPGIGPVSAMRILKTRSESPIRRLTDLKKMGVIAGRAESFILIAGKAAGTALLPFQLTG